MFTLLRKWMKKRQRAIDCEVLFPAIVEQAPTASSAYAVILKHMNLDEAWESFSYEQKKRLATEQVEKLWYN